MALTIHTRFPSRTAKPAPRQPGRSDALEMRIFQLERYLSIQHAITRIIALTSDVANALPRILQVICETTGWDFGEVWQVDRTDNLLHCAATWCSPDCQLPAFETSGRGMTFATGTGLPGRVLAGGRCAWIKNVVNDANFMRAPVAQQDGLRGGLGIPIRTEGEIIGVLAFFSRHSRQPERALLQMLDTVGSQIGLFIERKRIEQLEQEQAQRLAALEERQRLARDLHDSVTQSLFSASVIAEMLPIIWTRDPEQVKPGLDELHHLTHTALAEMRALLVELRPPARLDGELADLLHHLAEPLRNRAKIEVSLEIHLSITLPAETQIALYRITQEALHNIAKHASASRVSVRLIATEHRLELQIADNGHGFDPACIPDGHFGLRGMRERAEAIDTAFHVESIPGRGTRLSLIRTRPVTTSSK